MERQFNDLFVNIRDAILVADKHRRIVNCNPAFTDIFGYSLEDIEGAPTRTVYADPSQFEAMGAEIRKHSNDDNFFFTVQYRTKSGDVFPGETNVFYLRGDDGEPSAFVGVIRDISERKRREARHALIGEVSRNVAEAASFEDGLHRTLRDITAHTQWAYAEAWVPRTDDTVLEFAVGHAELEAFAPFHEASKHVTFPFGEGLPGRVYAEQSLEWIPNVSTVSAAQYHRRTLAEEHGVRAALGVPLADGSDVLAVLVFYLIEEQEDDERLTADITELVDVLGGLIARKKAADQIRAERNRLEMFASIVSHDLRNPLNVAQGRLSFAMADIQNDDLLAAKEALDRMEALIVDLLTLAKVGGNLGERKTVKLREVAESCWDDATVGEARLTVLSTATFEADVSRLRQLLENLFRNAVEHGDDAVEVTVGDLPDGFFVADDGVGIPDDEVANVFEVGYSSAPDGTGFGLAIVKEIVDAHGWHISVGPGDPNGTRFEITGLLR